MNDRSQSTSSPESTNQKSISPKRILCSRAPQWLGIDRDWWLTAILVTGSITLGFATVLWYKVPKPAAAVMCAFACLSVGSLLGFVFAIPRSISGRDNPARGDSETRYSRLAVNTNMEQISDWLTKLLVGVGLVELKELPQGLGAAARYVASSFGDDGKLIPFAAALLAYFTVEGFLGGYLATRIFFQRVFEESDPDLH